MKNKLKLLILLFFAAVAHHGISAKSDFEIVRQRVTETLVMEGSDDGRVKMLLVGDKLPGELEAKTQPIFGRAHLDAPGARPSDDRIKICIDLPTDVYQGQHVTITL